MQLVTTFKPQFIGADKIGNQNRFVLVAVVKDSDQTYVLIKDVLKDKYVIERARVTHNKPDVTTCDYEQIEDNEEWKKVYVYLEGTGIFRRRLKFFYSATQLPGTKT